MTNENINSSMIRVNENIKKELENLKFSNESYNDLFIRIINENKKLNQILLNVEELQEYLQEKRTE